MCKALLCLHRYTRKSVLGCAARVVVFAMAWSVSMHTDACDQGVGLCQQHKLSAFGSDVLAQQLHVLQNQMQQLLSLLHAKHPNLQLQQQLGLQSCGSAGKVTK